MIGYKIASYEGKRVLVTLDIPDDALTNSNRKGIKDKTCAIYRCNKARVLSIEDDEGNKYNNALTSVYNLKKIKYVVGEEVVEKDYNKNSNVVFGEGIHFFLSKEVALLYMLDKIVNGEYKQWYCNGQMSFSCSYKEGKIVGYYNRWDKDGKLINDKFFINGNLIQP